jgi:hypothetical protein
MHNHAGKQRIEPGRDVIYHDTEAAVQSFKFPNRWGLENIEKPE